jgi:hypothetical protein
MILTNDPRNEYNNQLTSRFTDEKELEFALVQFRKDINVHCMIKPSKKGNGIAVFTTGEYTDRLSFKKRKV